MQYVAAIEAAGEQFFADAQSLLEESEPIMQQQLASLQAQLVSAKIRAAVAQAKVVQLNVQVRPGGLARCCWWGR